MKGSDAFSSTFMFPSRGELCIYGFASRIAQNWQNAIWATLLQLAEAGKIKLGGRSIEWLKDLDELYPEEYQLLRGLFGDATKITFDARGIPSTKPAQIDPVLALLADARLAARGWLHAKTKLTRTDKICLFQFVVFLLAGAMLFCGGFGRFAVALAVFSCGFMIYLIAFEPKFILDQEAQMLQRWVCKLCLNGQATPKEWRENLPYMVILASPSAMTTSIIRVYNQQQLPSWWTTPGSSAQFGVALVELLQMVTGCVSRPHSMSPLRLLGLRFYGRPL